MNACVSAQQLEGKLGGGSLQKMRLFLRPFLGKVATTVILKRCLSTSPYSQMTVVVDTKTAKETARCVITGVFNLQFAEKLIMTYSNWYSIPGAVNEQKPP